MHSALSIEHNQDSSAMRKKTLSQRVEIGITALTIVTIVLVSIISLAYLANANRNATKGYALKNLERERSRLITENEIWSMQIAKVQALTNLQSDPKIKSMVKANEPMFIRGDTAVAAK